MDEVDELDELDELLGWCLGDRCDLEALVAGRRNPALSSITTNARSLRPRSRQPPKGPPDPSPLPRDDQRRPLRRKRVGSGLGCRSSDRP